jgi:hypothetical protein
LTTATIFTSVINVAAKKTAPGSTFTAGWNPSTTPSVGALLLTGHLNAAGGVSSGGVVLPQAGTIQSISVYCTVPSGDILLGIYDNSGSGGFPGKLFASTASTSLVAGWNTINVTTPVLLAAGTYWFLMIADSNTSQLGNAAGTAGHLWIDGGQPYSMPAIAPPAFNTDTPIISIYGTFFTQFALVPVKTAAPVISGTAQVGQTLTATAGTWANTPTSYTYQWNRGGTAISGAASSTYVPVAADVGSTLAVSVIATNGSGSSAPATSAPTSPVTAAGAPGVWTAATFASGKVRGFNQPGDNSLSSYQAAAAYGANFMRFFIDGPTGGLSNNGNNYRIGNGAYGTFDFTALDAIVANAAGAGLKIIWVIDEGKVLFTNQSLQNSFVSMWQAIATHYNGNTTIAGYDLWNEPFGTGASNATWIPLSQRTTAAIRAIDPDHVIIWEPADWGLPYNYAGITTMPLAAFPNVVYSFHAYEPHQFTAGYQGGLGPYGTKYPNPSLACYSGGTPLAWNASTLGANGLNCDGSGHQYILDLQAKYGFPIFIGEFSAFTAAVTNDNGKPSATAWVADQCAYFDSKGFAWAYHSWREWWGWDAEVTQAEAMRLYDNGKFDGSFPVNRDPNALTIQVLKPYFARNK